MKNKDNHPWKRAFSEKKAAQDRKDKADMNRIKEKVHESLSTFNQSKKKLNPHADYS